MRANIIHLLIIGIITLSGCYSQDKVYTPEPEISFQKSNPKPRINGAKIFGVRPGNPILYTIAATGERPMEFSGTNIPEGVNLNKETGQLTGSITEKGIYRITVNASNTAGEAYKEIRLVVGDEISLTPPMGFNTYGGWGPSVSEKNIKDGANALVSTGLINYGYNYVNIDDGWQGERGGKYNAIQPNTKFHDMNGLCDYVHNLGLKIGLYSTPWTSSYEGFIGGSSNNKDGEWTRPNPPRNGIGVFGKYTFEEADAKQIEEWGADYFKYDWAVDSLFRAEKMLEALRSTKRDIVFEISNATPFSKAGAFTEFGNMTRTTTDIVDVWSRNQLPDKASKPWAMGIRDIWLSHTKWQKYNRPGHWNMPCPLRVGLLGGWDLKPLRPTRLAEDEQYSHISLWCLWSAPLIIGCPPERLDKFTLGLLTNAEVLEIDQDPLGQQARDIKSGQGEVLVKDLEDGSLAIGLFNPDEDKSINVEANWEDIGIEGKWLVRDLWRQKDVGVFSKKFSAMVSSHGVILIRIRKE